MNYLGMAIDPSSCAYSRKNETRFKEVDTLLSEEGKLLTQEMNSIMQFDIDNAMFEFIVSGIIASSLLCYLLIGHILRCTCIKCAQSRAARRWSPVKEEQHEHINPPISLEDDLKIDCLSLQPQTKIVTFEEPEFSCRTYESYNGKPSAIKVGTVRHSSVEVTIICVLDMVLT